MIIQCDQCERKFRVDDSKIKPPGSRVRCSKCGNVFFVEKKEKLQTDQPAPPPEAPKELELDLKGDTSGSTESVGMSSSMEQESESPLQPEQSESVELPEEGKRDFVWTVNDIEAEEKAKASAIPESDEVAQDLQQGESPQQASEPESPVSQTDAADDQKAQAADENIGFVLDKLTIEEESPEAPQDSESVSTAEANTDGDVSSFSAPSVGTETFQMDLEPAKDMNTERDSTQEFSAPQLDGPDLQLDTNKVESVDQSPPRVEEPPSDPFKSSLSVDQNALSQIKTESFGAPPPDFNDYSPESAVIKSKYVPKSRGFGARLGSLMVSLIAGISILVIIVSVFLILSINFELLPKEKTQQLRRILITNLPIKVKDPLSSIKITDVNGKWLSTLNGPVYVLSGNVTNYSDNIVNYIKLKSEFTNAGELLFDKSIYAGNTFTDQELRSLPLNDILVKLNRKNGDIDFSDPRKLAGKNYNIMPGESVEFYSVFPSDNQILGLKYNIRVEDAEIVKIEESS